ncbi:hypothetical protein [Streptomyces sp. BE133]|uniref:hypothetical protein n=1 Tax=Streptomyces sp. BE133 TaxID=3002523 RepID=UPI002E7AAB3A|nr:hypothetical protein [Streptomyces sp. BE133]MEE1812697.1 hypothetical protein [Streptomyces sp. BE133]
MSDRVTDQAGSDKFGYTWGDARHHTQSTLNVSAEDAATLVEDLATVLGLEPYQIVQATPTDFVDLKNRIAEQ